MKSAHPLPKQAKVQIANAIAAAERRTSAELKVIICRRIKGDVLNWINEAIAALSE